MFVYLQVSEESWFNFCVTQLGAVDHPTENLSL